MKFSIKTALAAGAIAIFGSMASAATLKINGGDDGTIPAGSETNDILDAMSITSMDGFFGSSIELAGNSNLRIEFFGYEAGNFNEFVFDGNVLFDTTASTSGQLVSLSTIILAVQSASVLPFQFNTNGTFNDPPGPLSAINGSNGDNATPGANFFASFGDDTTREGKSLWLFFDDNGADNDDNHDDFVIRISVVPLPAGVLLLLTGVAGLGVASRRRKTA